MRVTLLWAEKSLHFIKINTPDISTNVQDKKKNQWILHLGNLAQTTKKLIHHSY